jgi:DNA replication protein DnaC
MISGKKLSAIQARVISSCECEGLGCRKCAYKCERLRKYAGAEIPVKYWNLAFKDFAGDKNFAKIVRDILDDISSFYEKGVSYAFVGNLGTGKSYAACCVLKKAIVLGYSGAYVQMADIVNSILSKQLDTKLYLDRLLEVDVLIIDEFDPRWVFPDEKVERLFGSNLEYILRTRFQNEMPTVLCSNAADLDKVLSSEFARAFSSLRSMYLNEIFVAGKDFRKSKDIKNVVS